MSWENSAVQGWDQLWPQLKGIGDLNPFHRICIINIGTRRSVNTSKWLPLEFKEVHLFSLWPTTEKSPTGRYHLPGIATFHRRQRWFPLARHRMDRIIIFAEGLADLESTPRLIPDVKQALTADGRLILGIQNGLSNPGHPGNFRKSKNVISQHLSRYGFSNIIVGSPLFFKKAERSTAGTDMPALIVATATPLNSISLSDLKRPDEVDGAQCKIWLRKSLVRSCRGFSKN